LVHSALGSTGYYASLGRELPPEVPVYGLNSIGLFGGAEPVRSFEAMAERYLAACRELYPKGPWILGGHSMGAYIAFEMCLQAGESRIPRCLVIDQAGPAYAGMGTLISNADVAEAVASLISVIASLYEQALPAPVEVIRDTLASADEAGQLRHIAGWLRELRFLPQAASDAMAEAFLNVLMANCIAETQWSPGERTYAGELSIIRARDSLHEPEAYAQWQQYCSRQIQAREISGSHATIMSRPYVLELAARLCELLGTRSAAIVPANLEERAECFPQMTT
jgi:thioesterase domain-containing protein